MQALKSDVTLKVCLFEDLKEAQELVITSSDVRGISLFNSCIVYEHMTCEYGVFVMQFEI